MKKIILTLLILFTIVSADEGLNTYYDLARKYVGVEGDCYVIANKYLRELYNDDHFSIGRYYYKKVSHADAQPGDVIYYANGGLDTTHWAVYLGDDLALQGNWLGKAKIASIYLDNATDPIFFHLISRTKRVIHFDLIVLEDKETTN